MDSEINHNLNNIKVEPNSFIATGSFDAYQNRINLKYFIEKIWIKFCLEFPKCKLYLTSNKKNEVLKVLNISGNVFIKYLFGL